VVRTDISICIATHRRPRHLARLLTSLAEQEEAPPFEVVVVDNDAARSGESVIEEFNQRLQLTYLVEPIRGLSRVRNRTVAATKSKYLAFIDDDHCADPRWLASHYQIEAQTKAAAVIGTTDVMFEGQVPDFIRNCSIFRKKRYSDREIVPWYHATTANCFIRRDALPDASIPFSPSFDLTGGEDVDLFYRMIQSGALVVASEQAHTVSYRPASRASLYWVLRRAFRNGGTQVEVAWGTCNWRKKVRRGYHAAVVGAKHSIKAAMLWRGDKENGLHRMLQACEQFGIVVRLFGLRIEEYRHHH
jgi:succinoglycan biosynthesis protein ExoM